MPNVGTIAGSYVQDGKVARNAQIRVVRDGIVIFNHWFVVIEGKTYIHLKSTTTEKDQEEMTLAILPDEISAPLAGLIAEGAE